MAPFLFRLLLIIFISGTDGLRKHHRRHGHQRAQLSGVPEAQTMLETKGVAEELMADQLVKEAEASVEKEFVGAHATTSQEPTKSSSKDNKNASTSEKKEENQEDVDKDDEESDSEDEKALPEAGNHTNASAPVKEAKSACYKAAPMLVPLAFVTLF
mmetsp:Transcript_58185/g.108948  ORF Transcript_58185/g.108948 Transcript_58185/m.108948 type:complete len:157 (-) Transcript_58185:49-519(-)